MRIIDTRDRGAHMVALLGKGGARRTIDVAWPNG
jgi:hypothetical protein